MSPVDGNSGYELIDAGEGRRLERFGEVVMDRPSAAAEGPMEAGRAAWRGADARFDRSAGWAWRTTWRDAWPLQLAGMTLELRPTPAGQVGVFPEQVPVWRWVSERAAAAMAERRPMRLLNLFAYTGGMTLAAAQAGAEVTHVDAARPAVAWARRNAELAGLASASIRWIVDDAATFVRRELRRGRRYDGIVLDPPSYGHGRSREPWQLERSLPALLADAAALTDRERGLVVLTAHTPGFDGDRLAGLLEEAFGEGARGGELELRATSGALLPLGGWARWAVP